jgi:uncharacterized tellurite resistance protein B-like protein
MLKEEVMGFFDLFTIKEEKTFINSLHEKFHQHFPNASEEKLVIMSCLAGLMARVAYIDFEVQDIERTNMELALKHWMELKDDEAKVLADIAITEMKALSGLDTRKFCTPLVDLLNVNERFKVLEALFQVAAADGDVDNAESNEISYISKSLVLENKYFLSARAQVKDFLTSLK